MGVFAGQRLACVRGERLVFTNLDFRIENGAALVLTGPNGSGKSSLLRLMADLARPAAGAITWDGSDIAADREGHRGRVRYAGHLDAVKPALSVLENVSFWAMTLASAPPNAARHRAEAALDAFGMGSMADVPGRFLSAGQRRRVSLARLLAAPAPLWLLDEPRTALDADAQRRLDGIIARHRQGGGLVVLSLHSGDRPAEAALLDLSRFASSGSAPC